jgi:hypothetical protein
MCGCTRTGTGRANIFTAQLQNIVQDLYELMVQTSAYDNIGPGVRSRDVLQDTMYVVLPYVFHSPLAAFQ